MLYERYRPKTLAEVLGQDKVTVPLARLMERNESEAIWLEGPSGTGKTSIALAIARAFNCGQWDTMQIEGNRLDLHRCRELETTLTYVPWSGRRCIIIDEAHAISRGAVQWLLTALERIPKGTWFLFTTTEELRADLFGEFSSPLASRCKHFRLTNQGLAPIFAHRAWEIAQAEGLNGLPETAYLALAKACRNNMRAMLQKIEQGAI